MEVNDESALPSKTPGPSATTGRRTQAERTATTRAALISAGRELFGTQGYAAVGTQAVVDAAGVTRGALYHQFKDKQGLFSAVYDDVEQGITDEIAERVGAIALTDPVAALRSGIRVFLEEVLAPGVQQITLVDAPAVLGWSEWRARGEHFGLALVEGIVQAAVDAGQFAPQPTRPVAHVAISALEEAALYVTAADDPARATAEMIAVLDQLVDAFTSPTGG